MRTARASHRGRNFLLGLAALAGSAAHAAQAPGSWDETVPVVTATVQVGPVVREVFVTGSVTSLRAARLSTAVAGLVTGLAVDVGDQVSAGDALLRLDDELARHARDSARAAVRRAEAESADARRQLAEAERLAEQQGIARSDVRSLEAAVAIAAAELERLQAEAERQQALLERHRLRAPFEGAVSRKLTERGAWINPGDEVLELVATRDVRLDFQIPQQYFPVVEPGMPVSITLDAVPDQRLAARVTTRVPVHDPTARTFLVRTQLEQDSPLVSPGMSARARLRLSSGEPGVLVDRDALLRHPDGRSTVWVLDAGSEPPTVSERQITPGLASGGQVEVVHGLEPGTTVVVRGNEALQQGQPVAPQRAGGDG